MSDAEGRDLKGDVKPPRVGLPGWLLKALGQECLQVIGPKAAGFVLAGWGSDFLLQKEPEPAGSGRCVMVLLGALGGEGGEGLLCEALGVAERVFVIEAQPWGAFARLLRVLPGAAAAVDPEPVLAGVMRRGQAELIGLRRWEERFVYSGLPEFEDALLAAGLVTPEALIACEGELIRAWRALIRPGAQGAELAQPMICWTVTWRQPRV